MSKRTELLNELARQALDQYGKDLKAGGEPIYPQWAKELQGVLGEHRKLVETLQQVRAFIVMANGETAPLPREALRRIDDALAAAEAA